MISPILLRPLIRDANGSRIPPGPTTRYLFLKKYPERALQTWAAKYGPLFSIWMGSQLFVVISDPHVARDLLVTNGAIFSSRKRYFIKSRTILHGKAITASEYGETCNMLLISFGIRTANIEDPLISRALELAMEFNDLTGVWSNPVDFFEPLQWFPSTLHKRGLKLQQDLIDVYGSMILRLKARLDAGEYVPECFVKALIQDQEKERLDWDDLCMLSAVFTLGGVHSISGIIQWFLALIPSHPEVALRAQEELDRVVGRDRLPTAEDEANLPYVRAIIKEVQRVHAPFWMATPHCTTEDFTYNGQYIPKGTAVVLNCYTLHHNSARYEDPWSFNPDRYVEDELSCAESAKLPNVMNRDHWTFGAGRRICPGIHVAERELWLAISQLLWSFNFHSLPEEPISLEEYEGNSGRTPVSFKLRFEPRDVHLESALKDQHEMSYWTL
ncbi:hypothetical protein HHX47_DHR1000067 [Lentinula edodes]|nr:hypothetical protein HHX47_DHR1000067 [Lentinula edodes]